MIVYSVICRAIDATVLVENTSPDLKGNAPQVTLSLLEHLRDHPDIVKEGERKTIVHSDQTENDFFSHFVEACSAALDENEEPDEHFFHLLLVEGVFYCCLGDNDDTREQKVNFAFLEHIQQEFCKLYKPRRILSANAYAMDKSFKPTLRSATHYHNINAAKLAKDVHVQSLTAKVDNLKTVMGRHINLLLERGENLDALYNKSQVLSADASIFKKKSRKMRNKMQRKYYYVMGIVAGIVAVLLYLIVLGICGAGMDHCRSSSSSSENGGGGGDAAANSGSGYNGGGYNGGQGSGGDGN